MAMSAFFLLVRLGANEPDKSLTTMTLNGLKVPKVAVATCVMFTLDQPSSPPK